MMSLIKAFQLDNSAGIVLAVNARLLSKNMQPFESFLNAYPEGQLLCWVGSGEPPIAQRKVKRIYRHFEAHGSIHRIGFDVKVREICVCMLSKLIWLKTHSLSVVVQMVGSELDNQHGTWYFVRYHYMVYRCV